MPALNRQSVAVGTVLALIVFLYTLLLTRQYTVLGAVVPRFPQLAGTAALSKNPQHLSGYETVETWRKSGPQDQKTGVLPWRPVQRDRTDFGTAADFLQQTIVADYPNDGVNDIFLMLQTSSEHFWDRMPVHIHTTLTRVPHFKIYSDLEGSLAGFPVTDVLEYIPEHPKILNTEEWQRYKYLKESRSRKWNVVPPDVKHPAPPPSHVDLDSLMLLPMLLDALKTRPDAKWFVMMRDTTFLAMDEVTKFLAQFDPGEPHYFGNMEQSDAQISSLTVPLTYASLDAGIVLSKAALESLFMRLSRNVTESEVLSDFTGFALDVGRGDAALALALKLESGLTPSLGAGNPQIGYRFQPESVREMEFGFDRWCQPVLSFGRLTPSDIEVLWEYERLRSKETQHPMTYAQIYNDFLLPYIEPARSGWGFTGMTYEWTGSDDDMLVTSKTSDRHRIFPSRTAKLCYQTCRSMSRCLSWSFRPNHCGVKLKTFQFGQVLNPWSKGWDATSGIPTMSGWMVDRIRGNRADQKCDQLQFDERGGVYNDRSDSEEGWYMVENDMASKPSFDIHDEMVDTI